MSDIQKTLATSISFKGKGLHTGLQVNLTLHPAPENHGFKFKRVDIEGCPILDASLSLVSDTSRGTVLDKDSVKISTIEHLLAAMVGSDLDNVLIELDGPEVPILDGSSKPFVEAIAKTGIVEQNATREYFVVKEKIEFKDEKSGAEYILLPDNEFSLNVLISFNSVVLNNQFASLNSLTNFSSEIASCRTFVFVRELEMLLQHNLVKGGDLDNAIVIMDQKMTQEEMDRIASLFNHKQVHSNELGILNNIKLSFDNEPARHKLLDVIGDLALVGKRIKGRVIATKPGHGPNVLFGREILKAIKKEETKKKVPTYDPNCEPLLDTKQIKELLPHRFPFLLVDKVLSISETEIIGIKNVTFNEPFFQGHFPSEPVMPGVLLLEAMAQCGGIYVIKLINADSNCSTYFLKMDNIKFRKKVVPGDTVIFKLSMTSPLRRGVANMKGIAYVGDSIVAEGEFMAQIVLNK